MTLNGENRFVNKQYLVGVGSDNKESTKFYTMDLNDDYKEVNYPGTIPQLVYAPLNLM